MTKGSFLNLLVFGGHVFLFGSKVLTRSAGKLCKQARWMQRHNSVPFNYMAEEAGFSNLGDVDEFVPDFLFCAVCARLSWTNAHAKQLTGLLRALRRGTEALYEDPDGAAATISSETQGNPEHARRACRDLVAKKAVPRG